MNFEFYTAGRIVFGRGETENLGKIALEYGKKAFLVTGRNSLKESGQWERIEGYF